MSRNRFFGNFEWPLIGLAAVLVVIGLLTLISATFEGPREAWTMASLVEQISGTAIRQLLFLGVGVGVAILVLAVDYHVLQTHAYTLYGVGILLLVGLFFAGETRGGSTRWYDLGFASFQPSELMKILTVVAIARYFARREPRDPAGFSLRELIPAFVLMALPAGLIIEQPDLGTALLVIIVGMSAIVFVGVRWKSLAVLVLLAAICAPFAWSYGLHDYQKGRVESFLHPDPNSHEYWQVKQSMIALGSGRFTGKGYLQGTQGRYRFLPAYQTDFIFAVWAEERGALGALGVLGLYLAFFLRGLGIARRAKDRFGAILAVGLVALFFWHVLINVSMVAGAMPVVGVPLPFLSYGGTFLTMTLLSTALICNVSMRRYLF